MDDPERLREIIAVKLGLDEADFMPEMQLADLDIDSLNILELIVAIEDEFDIELDDESFAAYANVGQMIDQVMAVIDR